MAESGSPLSAEDDQSTHALWTLLTAISGVTDEVERGRLTATSLPSLLPCHLSGLALLDEGEANWHVSLQESGRQLDAPEVDDVLTDVEELSQEAFRRAGLMTATAGGQSGDCAVPAAIENLGVQCLAVVPLMTLHHRVGILFVGRRHPDAFPRADVAVLLRRHLDGFVSSTPSDRC